MTKYCDIRSKLQFFKDFLRNLFKNVKNTHGEVLLLVKLKYIKNEIKINKTPHGVFPDIICRLQQEVLKFLNFVRTSKQ